MVTITTNDDGTKDIAFKQGETSVWHINIFSDAIQEDAADLTDYSARGMGRLKGGTTLTTNPELFPIECTISGNKVSCSIPPANSAANGTFNGYYDIEIYHDTDTDLVYRVMEGTWTMSAEVTVSA